MSRETLHIVTCPELCAVHRCLHTASSLLFLVTVSVHTLAHRVLRLHSDSLGSTDVEIISALKTEESVGVKNPYGIESFHFDLRDYISYKLKLLRGTFISEPLLPGVLKHQH